MRIALGQFNAGADKEVNLRCLADLATQAKVARAELVLFPEGAMAHFAPDRSLAPVAESLDGPFVGRLSRIARDTGLVIIAGMYESIPGHDRVYNTVITLRADGSMLGYYRKIHLFDAFGYRESDRIEPGIGETLIFSVGGVSYGVQTCYDIRFPELSRHLAERGADVFLLPAAWVHGLLKESHWEILVRARAIENTVYVAAAGQVGGVYSGSSMLVDPMGVPVTRMGEFEGIITGDVDHGRIRHVREALPSREHVRADIYRDWARAGVR